MKKERDVPTVKCAVLAFCFSILALMSVCAAGSAEAAGNTAQYSAAILADGDELLGGTYTAEGDDESVLEASGTVQASVTGAVLQKLDGSASSADASSFRGVNAGVRVYGNAAVTLDAASTWTLTGDSYVTSLDGELSGLDLNRYSLYVNGVAYAA